MPILRRLVSAVVDVRPGEQRTVVLMFLYSFLAMTAYNIVQPVTRSAVITDLGADNIPYVLLAAGLVITLLMQLYGWVAAWLPKRWALPLLQLGLTVILLGFWLGFRTRAVWVSAAFYLYGMMLGTLLLSQFWTLANELYDPRQARRIFGFIGGGASLGGMTGAGLAALAAETTGTEGLLLLSAGALVATAGVVAAIVRRATPGDLPAGRDDDEPPVELAEAWGLLRGSPDLRQISMLIGLAALGAVLIDQQLNMAAEQFREDEDAITQFLASVRFLLSAAALVIQVVFVNRIYRLLGIGFALVTLPVSFAATAAVILLTGALWAPAVASVVDRSIRYTVDRTTREIFFLPLPTRVKRRAKAFIDVSVDRLVRGAGAIVLLVLIKPWGLGLAWRQLSVVSLLMVVGWLVVAVRARRRYVTSVRKGLEQGDVEAADVRVSVADLTTVEALLEELGHPDDRRVLYAIDILESLDKRHLVTPLLLHHASPAVRARALAALASGEPAVVSRWDAHIHQLVDDPAPEVRAQAIVTLAGVRREGAADLARRFMDHASPRMAASAAVVLASTGDPRDAETAEAVLGRLATDTGPGAAAVRRDVAIAIRRVNDTRTRELLVPLLQDNDVSVAEEAMRSVGGLRPLEPLFIPTLISLLGNRRLKAGARDALVQYDEPALDLLAHTMNDPEEDLWVRRHIPATVGHIPGQRAMDVLVAGLDADDRFLRFKAVAAMTDLHRDHPTLTYPPERIDALLSHEARAYFHHVTLAHGVFVRGAGSDDTILAQVLEEKAARAVDRVYRLLALLHPWRDIAAARWGIERRETALRARAYEYLDNILSSEHRRILMPMLEDLPREEKTQRGHALLGTRPRDLDETLLELINDDDQVVAAAAIDLVRETGRWTLADDVEHVLAHRDARDWFAFEAASWTLSSRHFTSERQRARWLEPLPAIVLADRLRGLTLFRSVGVDELCRIAAAGRQDRHQEGETLLREGQVPDTIYVLLDGTLDANARSAPIRRVAPPEILGFESALEGGPAPETVRTAGPAVTLSIPREELLTLVAGSSDLVRGLFRTLATASATDPPPVVVPGIGLAELDVGRLGTVQRSLALQQVPLLDGLPSEEMIHLAAIARPLMLDSGATLSAASDPPVLCVVLRGALLVESDDGAAPALRAGPGDTVGLFETLAGTVTGAVGRRPMRLTVAEPGAALQVEREDLFDLLGQRPALLQHLFGVLFAAG